jgi:hypothetical protein
MLIKYAPFKAKGVLKTSTRTLQRPFFRLSASFQHALVYIVTLYNIPRMDSSEKGRSAKNAFQANIVCTGKALAIYCMKVLSDDRRRPRGKAKTESGRHESAWSIGQLGSEVSGDGAAYHSFSVTLADPY